jgi:hypothetical protein
MRREPMNRSFTQLCVLLLVGIVLNCSCSSVFDASTGSESETPYTLLNTIDITQKLSANSSPVGRPDVIAIQNELFLAYSILAERHHHLVKLNPDLDLTLVETSPLELFSGYHDSSVDIRVSEANNELWYAFEDNRWNAGVDSTHYLNAAWYSSANTIIGQQTDIAIGITTVIPEAFLIDPSDVPLNPEACDDPTPFWHNDSYYIFTRAWSGWIEEFTPNSKHHVRIFDETFEKTDDFILDLSTVAPGKTLSQNTLIDIDGQVYLIGGLYNMRNDIAGGSSVFAIPLSDDLKTAEQGKVPLLAENGQWFFKVTKAKEYDGKLFINYQQYISGYDTQNIAVFDIGNSFELIWSAELSRFSLGGEGIIGNHTSFEILNDRLYVFYPEIGQRIFAKIFSL